MFYTCVCLSVCLFVCLFVSPCLLDYPKSCERISMNFFGGVRRSPRESRLDCGGYPDHNPDPEL